MPVRFTLVVLFAMLAAASRPIATGGEHDLLAVGVRIEENHGGKVVRRTVLAVPDATTIRAYETILRSPSGDDLRKKTVVQFTRPVQAPSKVLELVYYGVRSRAGAARILFEPSPEPPSTQAAAALEAAASVARLPDSVTAAAARVVIRGTADDAAFGEALTALAAVDAVGASAEARAAALDGKLSGPRRSAAVRVLVSLGGARAYPEEFRRLAADADPLVSAAAK